MAKIAEQAVEEEAVEIEETRSRIKQLQEQLKQARSLIIRSKELFQRVGSLPELEKKHETAARELKALFEATEKELQRLLDEIHEELRRVFGKEADLYKSTLEILNELRWHKNSLQSQIPSAFGR